MRLVAFGQTDIGRVREHNEDSLAVDPQAGFFMVADGVGGGQAGDVASSMAIEIVHRCLQQIHGQSGRSDVQPEASHLQAQVLEALPRAINQASEAIFNRGQTDSACRGMATTTSALQISGTSGVVGHVGDSRLYLVREGIIYQVTEDHTLLQKLLQTGAIQQKDAASFPHRNIIARSVGKSPAVQVDTLVVDVHPGDRFVLCSDGLSDLVSAEEIKGVVSQMTPKRAVQMLIAMANERGGPDNITAIVIDVEGERPSVSALRTEQKAGFLREVFLFKDLTFQEVLRVLTVVHEQRYRDGDVVIREGDFGDALYILVQGEAVVSTEGVFLTRIQHGGHFGELGLLGDGRRSATVTAVGDTVLLSISKADFYQLVSCDHSLSVKLLWGFLQNLGGRVKSLSHELSQLRASMRP